MDEKAVEKKDRLLAALDRGMVMVHLDARRPGVVVPPSFRTESHLRLNLSYRFDPPDLTVGEWGIRATLSFSGSRFPVAIPWSSLFGVTSYVTKERWLFPDDLPEELLETVKLTEKVPLPVSNPEARPRPRPVSLEVVSSKMEDDEEQSASPGTDPQAERAPEPVEDPPQEDPPPRPTSPSRGHLRLVK